MRIGPFSFFEKKDATLSNPDPELLNIFGIGVPGSISRAQALAVPAVNAAIRSISEAAACMDIRVVRINEDGTETDDPKHDVAMLLRGDVNEWTSSFEFVRDLAAMAMMTDQGGVAWVNRVDGRPQEIILYKPGKVAVTYADDTGEPSYKIGANPIPSSDIIHLRSPFSQCPLTLAMRAIEVAWHLENHARNLFKKGARPGGVIEFPKMLGDEGLKKMKAGWRAAFGGSDNSGETAVLWDGASFKAMTLNSTDSQFLENRRFQVLEVARAFRVPPSMLFDLERQTYTNGEQQGKEFLTYGVEPWLRALEACMARALFNEGDRKSFKIVFDRDDLTQASLTERAQAISSLIASETINPNTGRKWIGLQPYEGGEKYGNRNINVDPPKPAKPMAVAA